MSGSIQVRLVRVPEDDSSGLEYCGTLLSANERTRLARLKTPALQKQYLATRGTARVLLSRETGIAPAEISFSAGEHGRPELVQSQAGTPPLRFNLSHSASMVAMAITRSASIGIDIEPVSRGRTVLELARRTLHHSEQVALDSTPMADRAALAIQYWTLKESYLKARGIGMRVALTSVGFALADDGPPTLLSTPPDDVELWQHWLHKPEAETQLALTVRRSSSRPEHPTPMFHPIESLDALLQESIALTGQGAYDTP